MKFSVWRSCLDLAAWVLTSLSHAATVIKAHTLGQHTGFVLPQIALLSDACSNLGAFDYRNRGGCERRRPGYGLAVHYDIKTAIAGTNSRLKLRAGALPVLAFCFSAVVMLPRLFQEQPIFELTRAGHDWLGKLEPPL